MDNQNQNTNPVNGINSNEPLNLGTNLNIESNAVPFQTIDENNGDNSDNSTLEVVGNTFNTEPNNTIVTETLNEVPMVDNIAPIKPTLDSILNPSDDTNSIIPNQPIVNEVPTNTSNEPTNLTNENVVKPIISQEPLMETISSDAVIDNSLKLVNNQANSIPNNMLNENPTVLPTEPVIDNVNARDIINNTPTSVANEPIMNDTNSIGEAPVIESIEEIKVPVVESIENNNSSQVEESNNEPMSDNSTKVPTIESIEPPVEVKPPVDDFDAVPMPPVLDENEKKNKKGGSKVLVIILIIILIGAIGYGVYYFLNLAKTANSNNSIETKELKLELGTSLPNDIDYYANINGFNKSNCSLNTDSVDLSKVGTSKFSVTCGKTTEEGLVIIDDNTSPKVKVNDLTILINSPLNAEDFIESCEDATTCSYAFITDVSSITSKAGDYEVEILASDEYNNQTIVKTTVTVARTAPASYMICTKNDGYNEEFSANYKNLYRIGIDGNNVFHSATRIVEYNYNSLSDYNNLVSTYNETVGVNGIIGTTTFDEQNMTVTIKNSITLDEMNKDLNGNLPSNANVLKAYLSGLGYDCN